jgi:EmrB/QacA subfamily drug resistance transporter
MAVVEDAVVRTARPARHPTVVFGLLAAVQFLLIAAITVLSIALPAIQRDFGLSTGDMTLVSTAYGLSFSGLLILGGRLADQFGHRRMFLCGLAIFCVASAVAGLAPGSAVLVCGRFLQGLGAALSAPAAIALLGTVFPEPVRRQRMTAVWGTVASVGATMGTVLSGVVISLGSWRLLFLLLVAFGGVALAFSVRLVPVGPPPSRARLDVAGAVLATAGLGAVLYGLVGSTDRSWSSASVVVPVVVGAVLLAAFVLVEARSPVPLVPLGFLAAGRRAVGLVAVFSGSAAMSGVFFFLALYFQEVRGYSSALASAAFVPFAVVLLATGSATGHIVVRFGARRVMVVGLLLAAGGLLWLAQLDVDTPYVLLLPGLLVFPVGAGLTFAGATVLSVSDVPEADAGLAGGVVNTALEVGPTVGLAALVSLAGGYAAGHGVTRGYGIAFLAAGVVMTVVAVIALAGRGNHPKTVPRERNPQQS